MKYFSVHFLTVYALHSLGLKFKGTAQSTAFSIDSVSYLKDLSVNGYTFQWKQVYDEISPDLIRGTESAVFYFITWIVHLHIYYMGCALGAHCSTTTVSLVCFVYLSTYFAVKLHSQALDFYRCTCVCSGYSREALWPGWPRPDGVLYSHESSQEATCDWFCVLLGRLLLDIFLLVVRYWKIMKKHF